MFKNKWLVLSLMVLASLVMAACQPSEVVVTVEVPGEGGETIVVTATPGAAAGGEAEAPAGEITSFQTGIYEDLTSTNYWAVLDTEATTWNFYVVGNYSPAMYGLAPQRFDWVPGIAADFPSARTQEGEVFTITAPLTEGLTWTDGEPVTAADVAYTFSVIQGFQLSSNWSTYNPPSLVSVEAVDDYTVKYTFNTNPGLGDWEFGVALAPILAEHFWKPITDPIAADNGLNDLDAAADPEGYAAASANARTALYAVVPENEPVYGPMTFGDWEPGAFAENVARADFPEKGFVTNLYDNGAYEAVQGDATFTAYGDPSGDPYLSVETGPFVPSVVFSLYGSQDAAVLALLDGEIDYIFNPNGLTRGLFEQVSGAEGIVTVENPNYGFRYLAFNLRKPFTGEVALRQAMATVIDQSFITNSLLQGSAIPMYTVMPEANRYWYNPDTIKWGEDADGNALDRAARIAKAVQILKDAGFTWQGGGEPTWNEDNQTTDLTGTLVAPDGTVVPELKMMAPSAGYDPMRATAAIWIEQWANEIGIPVKAELTGFNNIADQVFAQGEATWDMYILGWGLGNPAFPTFFDAFFNSAQDTAATGGFNTPGYTNADFDALIAAFNASQSVEEARDYAFEMQVMLSNDLPYITLFTTPLLEAYSSNVQFAFTDGLGGIEFYYGQQGTVKAFTAAAQ